MPFITRLGDTCTGHGSFPPRASIEASTDVIVNGKGAVREGDAWAVHCSGKSCHGGSVSAGSSSVFVNGIPVARIGDPLDCGSSVATGSGNVSAGG